MADVIKHPDHPEDMAARVEKRLRPSNLMTEAKWHHQAGDGARRTHTTGHGHGHGGKMRGNPNAGEGDITGKPRRGV